MNIILTIGGGVLAWGFGQALWILPVVNFSWLLFKDKTLFSWWVVLWVGIAFIVSLLIAIVGRVTAED